MASPPPQRAEPKLRDSCHACAASKLKCSKEKPACLRCTKRGKTCQYLVTRRAGRTRGKQPKKAPETHEPTTAATTVNSTHPSQPQVVDSIETFLEQYGNSYQDILASPGHGLEQHFPSTSPSDVDLMMEDYFASPISLRIPELMEDSNQAASITTEWKAQSQLLDPDLTVPLFGTNDLNFFTLPHPQSLSSNSLISTIPNPSVSEGAGSLPGLPHCGCLPKVLELLQQLCTTVPDHCTIWPGPKFDAGPGSTALLQSMIAENKSTLDAISRMLHCPCLQDGYLLATICLVVLKVMGRYEAAARSPTLSSAGGSSAASVDEDLAQFSPDGSLSIIIGCYNVESDDSDRIGAQIVLSELHRVQQLIKGLSKRLNVAGLSAKDDNSSHNTHISSDLSIVTGGHDVLMNDLADTTLPFYAPFFGQLESDLRKRLRRLSEQTADIVRRA